MAKKKLPTQRTLERLRESGVTCDVVERFLAHAGPFGVRKDLFGCIDIIALISGRGIVGVQATSASNHASHVKKCLEEPRLVEWLKAGGGFEIWSWKKTNPKGTKLTRWMPRIDIIQLPQQQELTLTANDEPNLFE